MTALSPVKHSNLIETIQDWVRLGIMAEDSESLLQTMMLSEIISKDIMPEIYPSLQDMKIKTLKINSLK